MFNSELISELRSRIAYLEKEVAYHRRKADLATDELLRKNDARPIMPEKFVSPEESRVRGAELDKIKAELESVGSLGDESPEVDKLSKLEIG